MSFTHITNDIKITVHPSYRPDYSRPGESKFVFSYQIRIENRSRETVQLLRRHWFIFDSNGERREVEGEGVIGEQPVLPPGASHQYASWCPLLTDIGKMHGHYLFHLLPSRDTFQVAIPEFHLIVPSRMN